MRRIKVLFFEDVGLKVVSVAGAIAIWFFVNQELTEVRTLRVPVTLDAPVGRVVAGPNPVVVKITIRGPRGKISPPSPREFVGRYRIPENAGDELTIELRENHFQLPASGDVHITRIDPPHVLVKLTREFLKQMRVHPIPRGNPAEGMEVVGASAYPDLVTVTGAEEQLRDFEYIETEPVNISGHKETVSARVGIADHVDGPEGPVAVSCGEQVTVTFEIRPKLAERSIPNVPVRVLVSPGSPRNIKVEPAKLNVRVRGNRGEVVRLVASDILLLVDLTKGVASRDRVPVRCQLPAGVSLAAEIPSVTVSVLAE